MQPATVTTSLLGHKLACIMRLGGVRLILSVLACLLCLVAASCGGRTENGSENSTQTPEVPDGWVDEDVTFTAGKVTVHGSYQHPKDADSAKPAALLIAGSGPSDRNGNSDELPGDPNTLRKVSRVLADEGVASLRYDKLGAGKTGLGPYQDKPEEIGIDPFADEARAGLEFLTDQPDVDPKKLSVYGHSEGAFFALLVATDEDNETPPVHAFGLLEPLSTRYLDLITKQLHDKA